MELLLQLIQNSQKRVTGKVKIQLYKGNCVIQGRSSPFNLYDPAYATFEADEVYSQADAQGFIQLQGLRLRVASLLGEGPSAGSGGQDPLKKGSGRPQVVQ